MNGAGYLPPWSLWRGGGGEKIKHINNVILYRPQVNNQDIMYV